jgi:exodeoxyribonuclease-3
VRLVTWNVNSIRVRIDAVVAWVERHEPDVVLLQETKCTDAVFDSPAIGDRLADLGYDVVHHGTNHYNGVATASRVGLADPTIGFTDLVGHTDGDVGAFGEARLLSTTCAGLRIHNVYVPNGRKAYTPHWESKVAWLRRLGMVIDPTVPTIVAGDMNVQRADVDVYDPVRWRNRNHATPEERAALAALLELGFRDVVRDRHPEPGVYTWWNHAAGQFTRNRGMRIDLVLASPDVARRVDDTWIDTDERGRPRSSDHAPVVVDINIDIDLDIDIDAP